MSKMAGRVIPLERNDTKDAGADRADETSPDANRAHVEPVSVNRMTVRKSVRRRASWGHARTQAGPPNCPTHRSHLVAFKIGS